MDFVTHRQANRSFSAPVPAYSSGDLGANAGYEQRAQLAPELTAIVLHSPPGN